MEKIKNIATELANLYETMHQLIEPMANDIIDNRITDINIIEHCLDYILDIPTNKGWQLLQRLGSYYMVINKENALFYIETYQEMYDLKPKTKKRT